MNLFKTSRIYVLSERLRVDFLFILYAWFSLQTSRSARIRQLKAASCNAFINSKKRADLHQMTATYSLFRSSSRSFQVFQLSSTSFPAVSKFCPVLSLFHLLSSISIPAGSLHQMTATMRDDDHISIGDLFQIQHHHLLNCLEHTTVRLIFKSSLMLSILFRHLLLFLVFFLLGRIACIA